MWIGITLGDVTGIGPEVTLKALAAEAHSDDARYLIIGDAGCARSTNLRLGLNLPLEDFRNKNTSARISIFNPLPAPLAPDLAAGSAAAANAAVAWLKEAAERCLRRELDAMVTAPVSKENIIRAGHAFVGQTEFLSQIAGTDRTVMMLLGHDEHGRWLRVALATTHVPIKMVSEQLTRDKIELAIELAAKACRDLRLPRARIAVCGLNPHAGEGGYLGREEIDVIKPVVDKLAAEGLGVSGPYPADTLFTPRTLANGDAALAMFHDQGLPVLKHAAFGEAVNVTLGLPIIRTSVDHGTALDRAGTGEVDAGSLRAAIALAFEMAARAG